MKKQTNAGVFIWLVTASCGATYAPAPVSVYAPAPTISMLKEKGEFRGNLHYQLSALENDVNHGNHDDAYTHGAGLNLAYAVGAHWALTAGYNAGHEKQKHFEDVLRYKRSTLQFGVGYFTTVSKQKRLYADIYAGYHHGSNKLDYNFNYYQTGKRYYNVGQSGFYIQPGIFVAFNNRMKLGVSIKNSVIWFNRIRTNFPEEIMENYYPELQHLNGKTAYFFQPAFNFEFPFPKTTVLRGNIQLGRSFKGQSTKITYNQPYFTAGFSMYFDRFQNNKTSGK